MAKPTFLFLGMSKGRSVAEGERGGKKKTEGGGEIGGPREEHKIEIVT
jgi:hypothetical protein